MIQKTGALKPDNYISDKNRPIQQQTQGQFRFMQALPLSFIIPNMQQIASV